MTMRSRLGAVLVSAACGVPACVLAADTAVRTFGTNGTTRVLLHPSNNTAGEKNVVFWYEGKDGVVVDGEGQPQTIQRTDTVSN